MVTSDVIFASRANVLKQSNGSELQEVLQDMSLNEDDGGRGLTLSDNGNLVRATTLVKRPKTRDIASRYKAPTISSANAAAITAQRYQSPSRCRSPSPNFGIKSHDSTVHRVPMFDSRPLSAERRRPWPGSASENSTPAVNIILNTSRTSNSFVKKMNVAQRGGHVSSTVSSFSSSIQSDASISSFNDNKLEQGGLPSNEEGKLTEQSCMVTENKSMENSEKRSQGKTTPLRRTPLWHSPKAPEGPWANCQGPKAEFRRWPSGKSLLSRSMDFSSLRKESSLLRTASSPLSSRSTSKAFSPSILSRSANEGTHSKVVRRIYIDQPTDERASKAHHADADDQGDDDDGGDGASIRYLEEDLGVRQPVMQTSSLDDNGSDTESSSSGSLSIASSFGGLLQPRGTVVTAHMWQGSASTASIRHSKVHVSTRSLTPVHASHSGFSTPQHPSSPSSQVRPVQVFSSSRGLESPTKTRTGHPMLMSQRSFNGRRGTLSGLLNMTFDTRKNKQVMGQQEEAHDLRMLHNRWMQWRFVNAQSELAMKTQMATAESLLYRCCLRVCELQISEGTMQCERNKFRQKAKLESVLQANVMQLDKLESVQSGHTSALTGLTNALEATVVRVPLLGGLKVDIKAMKEVLSHATEIMSAVDASVNRFLGTAEIAESLLTDLAKTIVMEKACLVECGDLLVKAATLEVEECSLRAYLVQHEQEKVRPNRVNIMPTA